MAWASSQHTGSASRKAVLLALANRANHDTGLCCPSVERISEETEIGERTVRQALADLHADGFITRTRTRREDGSFSNYRYGFPLADPAPPPATVAADPAADSAGLREPGSLSNLEETMPPNGGSASDVQIVYDHWRKARGKERSNYDVISASRRAKIRTRLREFERDDLIAAIDNIARDPWPDRAMHDDITIVFRSREQVEKFLEMGRLPIADTQAGATPKRAAEQWVRTAGWQYPDADLWEELGRFDLSTDEKREMTTLAMELQRVSA